MSARAGELHRRATSQLLDLQETLAQLGAELAGAALEASLEPAAPAAPRAALHVCVDPGHGGHDPGAVALDGTKEKDLALEYGQTLQAELTRRGHRVTMTRTGDTYPELAARARKADEVGADVLLSLHANAAESRAANGAWVIYDDTTTSGPKGGKSLAEAIFRALARVPGVGNQTPGLEVFPDRSPQVGNRNLAVLSTQRAVAVLVELGFLTNEEDLSQLKGALARRQLVQAMADGLEAWAAAGPG